MTEHAVNGVSSVKGKDIRGKLVTLAAIPANSLASSSFDVNGTIGSGLILHFGLMWVES
jgi:hypothetical protein